MKADIQIRLNGVLVGVIERLLDPPTVAEVHSVAEQVEDMMLTEAMRLTQETDDK